MLRHRLPPLAPDHVRSTPGGVWLDLCIEAHLPGRPCPGAPPPDPWRSVIFRVVDTRIREEVADAAAVAAHSVAAETRTAVAGAPAAMALATQAEASQPGEPAGDGGRGSQEPERAPGPQAEAAVPAPEGEPAEGSRPAKAARLA
jgi:hypothetical protein